MTNRRAWSTRSGITGWGTRSGFPVAVLAVAGIALAAFLAVAPFVPRGPQPADAGEFQLVARELGVAHPPGYPLYTMAAHAFGRVVTAASPGPTPPSESWPYAINLFSTALAIATLIVVAFAGRRASGSWPGGLIAAAVLAACPTFVSLALVANIRMATGLLCALVLLAALYAIEGNGSDSSPRDQRAGRGGHGLVALGVAMGLAAGHHPSLVFLAPPVGLALAAGGALTGRPTRQLFGAAAAAALAWLLPQAYLPIRDAAGAALAPGDLGDPAALWRFVTGAAFRGDLLNASDASRLLDRTRVVLDVHVHQFGAIVLALAGIGFARLAAVPGRRPIAILLAGTALIVSALAILYRAPQTVEYLVPAYVALAILAGAAVGAPFAPRLRFGALVGAIFAMVLARALLSGLPWTALEAAPDITEIVETTLEVAACHRDGSADATASDPSPPDADDGIGPATVLAAWHWATPLWSATDPRSAVDIRYVAPDWRTGDPIGVTWRKAVEEAGQDGPVMLTNRTRELIESGRPLWPVRGTPFWSDRPLDACASGGRADSAEDVESGDRVGPGERVESAEAEGSDAGADAEPGPLVAHPPAGGVVALDIERTAVSARDGSADAWIVFNPASGSPEQSATQLSEPLSLSVQLVESSDGTVWAQADRTLSAAEWNDDRGVVVRLALFPFAGTPPEALDARLGLYVHGAGGPESVAWSDGRERISIGLLDTAAWSRLLPAPGAIPFGDAMALESSRVSRDGDALRIDLDWRAENAHRSDYTISVHAEGEGWMRQHDGTPALGAIPTLKWLRGWSIHDRHRIRIPAGVPADEPITISVGVYDAFSLEPLPVTDAERVRAGEGQRAVIHRGPLSE